MQRGLNNNHVRLLAAILGFLGPVVLLLAAFGKILSGGPLEIVLPKAGVYTLPFWGIVLFAALESVPFALAVSRRVVVANVVCAILFGGFLLYAISFTASVNPPDCNCFGLWSDYFATLSDARLMVFRNAVLLALPVLYLFVAVAIPTAARLRGRRVEQESV